MVKFYKLRNSIPLYVGLLFVLLFIVKGHPVPELVTEYLYLPCLVKQFNPSYIPNDWTLAGPFYEHYVFNVSFGWLTLFLSMEAVGWMGRILCWLLMSAALLRLGKRIGIPVGMAFLGVVLWLNQEQSMVASSWMIGGFEAKVVAYLFLIVSFHLLIDKRHHLGSLCLGLCFSFHPAVGLWGGLAVGLAVLLLRTPIKTLATMTGFVVLGALPGFIATITLLSQSGANSMAAWKFVVLVQSPQHFDSSSWPLRNIILVYWMFFFNILSALTFRNNRALQFLLYVQLGLGFFFTVGLYWGWTNSYGMLRYFPFRLFPLLVPLCFFWQTIHAFHHYKEKSIPGFAVLVGLIGLMSLKNPMAQANDHMRETRRAYEARNSDIYQTLTWVRQHTPKKSIVIQPPWSGYTFHVAQRAQIANWWANRYDKLPEWKERLEDMVGVIPAGPTKMKVALMKKRYNNLSLKQIKHLVTKYRASYLVTQGSYTYPLAFQTQTFRVYDLRGLGRTLPRQR